MRWWWIPLLLFAGFVGVAAYQLTQPKDEFVRSAMIGEPLPQFTLKPSIAEMPGVTTADFRDGTPRLLNIWASWCLPCIADAPQLERLREAGVEIVGVAIRDRPEDVSGFLARHGNPSPRIGADDLSEVMLAIGPTQAPHTPAALPRWHATQQTPDPAA